MQGERYTQYQPYTLRISYVDFCRVRPGGRTLFFILSSIFYSMTPSHIPQIFLRIAIQNQIRIAQRIVVDEASISTESPWSMRRWC